MALVTKPSTFSAGETIKSAEVNNNFDTLYNDYNGGITNANIDASAGIVGSKLDLSSPGTIGATTPGVAIFSNVTATTITSTQIYVSNTTTTNGVEINQVSLLGNDEYALYVYSNTAQTNSSGLLKVHQKDASTTAPAFAVTQSGEAYGSFLEQLSPEYALYIDQDSTTGKADSGCWGMRIDCSCTQATAQAIALHIVTDAVDAGSGSAFYFGGDELTSGAALTTQNLRVRVNAGGTIGYIQLYA